MNPFSAIGKGLKGCLFLVIVGLIVPGLTAGALWVTVPLITMPAYGNMPPKSMAPLAPWAAFGAVTVGFFTLFSVTDRMRFSLRNIITLQLFQLLSAGVALAIFCGLYIVLRPYSSPLVVLLNVVVTFAVWMGIGLFASFDEKQSQDDNQRRARDPAHSERPQSDAATTFNDLEDR